MKTTEFTSLRDIRYYPLYHEHSQQRRQSPLLHTT
jgi:hypothetical protein